MIIRGQNCNESKGKENSMLGLWQSNYMLSCLTIPTWKNK